jgi:hypothetical protein
MATEKQHGLVAWNIKPKLAKPPKPKPEKGQKPKHTTEVTVVSAYIGLMVGVLVNMLTNAPLLPGLSIMFALAVVYGFLGRLASKRGSRK